MLLGAGFSDVVNISGGHISLQRQARAAGFETIKIGLLPIVEKSIEGENEEVHAAEAAPAAKPVADNTPLVIDVRTRGEFASGAVPGAINIPLDELVNYRDELGSTSRDITLYCASGARSAYGQRILMQLGFTNVKNGGGIMHMMMRR